MIMNIGLRSTEVAALAANTDVDDVREAFARTAPDAAVVHRLDELTNEGRLPPIPVYVDSPLAVNVTDVFRRHPECYDDELVDWALAHRPDEFVPIEDNSEFAVTVDETAIEDAARVVHGAFNLDTAPA